MGPCSRGCATERSVDRVVVNKCFVGCTAVRADSSSGISLFGHLDIWGDRLSAQT